jgi:hypothetical protein
MATHHFARLLTPLLVRLNLLTHQLILIDSHPMTLAKRKLLGLLDDHLLGGLLDERRLRSLHNTCTCLTCTANRDASVPTVIASMEVALLDGVRNSTTGKQSEKDCTGKETNECFDHEGLLKMVEDKEFLDIELLLDYSRLSIVYIYIIICQVFLTNDILIELLF